MQEAQKKYFEELEQHYLNFTCEHKNLQLRKRSIKSGNIQYVKQCLDCGNAMPQPIKAAMAFQLNGGNEPSIFDEQVIINRKAEKEKSYQEIKGRYDSSKNVEIDKYGEWYREYLKSPEWKLKREKVLKRAKNICEGCAEETAIEVHHISYANIGDELLFQLVALCEDCHRKAHSSDLVDADIED